MKKLIATALGALFLAAASGPLMAAQVTLTGWAFGAGNTVKASTPGIHYSGLAGAFGGQLTESGAFDNASFVTYCIELEEHFSFGKTALTGYDIVDGASYFQRRRGDADIAERLGRLMTFAADNTSLVENAQGSTALQLAIWSTVYDHGITLTALSSRDQLPLMAMANTLLTGASSVLTSRYDVHALERRGSQDFLLLSTRAPQNNAVPEPGSLALVAMAFGGLCLVRRRQAAKR